MFDSKNLIYILTILEAIEKITIYSQKFDDAEVFYRADKQLYFNATVNLLIAIGEENKKIDEKLKTSEIINWKNLSAMRDKISHDYRGVDEEIVWSINPKAQNCTCRDDTKMRAMPILSQRGTQ